MDPADDVALAGEITVERVRGARLTRAPVVEDASDPAAMLAIHGEGVRLLLVLDLQGVLDPAQEAVGVGQAVGVVRGYVPGRPHLCERRKGRGRAKLGVRPSVHELQHLHGELDVADAARCPLDLLLGHAAADHIGLRPLLEHPERPQVVGGEPPAPEGVRRRGRPVTPDVGVPRDWHGLQQCLELPGLGPPVPVGDVAVDGPCQCAVASLGTEVGVHPEAAPGDVEDPAGLASVALDEQHVDVTGVVELAAPELAHADHGQGTVICLGDANGGPEHGRCQLGEGGGRGLQVVEAEQVASHDPELLRGASSGSARRRRHRCRWGRQCRDRPGRPGRRDPRGSAGRRSGSPPRWSRTRGPASDRTPGARSQSHPRGRAPTERPAGRRSARSARVARPHRRDPHPESAPRPVPLRS